MLAKLVARQIVERRPVHASRLHTNVAVGIPVWVRERGSALSIDGGFVKGVGGGDEASIGRTSESGRAYISAVS